MIVGVDEVGRGCLFGNVVAAAVILPENFNLTGLMDSKKLTAKKREELSLIIARECKWAIGEASPEEIDKMNILQATMLAMERAVKHLTKQNPDDKYHKILVDGNRCPKLANCEAIIKGDTKENCISAASIVAKVYRDKQMIIISQRYPRYGFDRHKGYGTKEHINAIKKFGVLAEHRKSFAPVKNFS